MVQHHHAMVNCDVLCDTMLIDYDESHWFHYQKNNDNPTKYKWNGIHIRTVLWVKKHIIEWDSFVMYAKLQCLTNVWRSSISCTALILSTNYIQQIICGHQKKKLKAWKGNESLCGRLQQKNPKQKKTREINKLGKTVKVAETG